MKTKIKTKHALHGLTPGLLLLALGATALVSADAQAALIVDVNGLPGSGQTTWTFSGSAIASGNGNFFRTPGSGNNDNMWQDIGSFTAIQDANFFFSGGAASISINSGTPVAITAAYFDNDDGLSDDWTAAVASNLLFNPGDVVSWTGVATINSDVNFLFDTSLPAQFTSSNFSPGTGLALQLNVSPVPEPSAALLLLGSGAMLLLRRRRAAV